jgi:thiosulfate/3-mercaptopyruvate sulfurtransferase
MTRHRIPALPVKPALFALLALLLGCAQALAQLPRALVDAASLRAELASRPGSEQLLVLDASPTPRQQAAHIPGAVNADFYAYGLNPGDTQAMQDRLRRWGVRNDAAQRIVVYDAGADHVAARVYFDLVSHGVAPERIRLLDGGLHQWKAQGGATQQGASARPTAGDLDAAPVGRWRADLPEVLARRSVLLDALDPPFYFGAMKFLERGGHLPGALNLPASSLFRADKTFVPVDELSARLQRMGVRREQAPISYCGGGVAAAVPFFALQALLGWDEARLYPGSQREYLLDERQLPLWQEAQPVALRDRAWLDGWGQPLLRQMDAVHYTLVDLRPAEDFARERMPHAINLPIERWRALRHQPQQLAAWLGSQGLTRGQEAVLVSARAGLDADKALALVLLESLGQWRVSLLRDTLTDWELMGAALDKGGPLPVPRARDYLVLPRDGLLATGDEGASALQLDASVGLNLPALQQAATPWRRWELLTQSGVQPDAPLLATATDPGDAALGYLLLRSLGLPQIRVRL